jgi:hypothetical protein
MQIYDELTRRGLVHSERGYSRLMGMSDNYVCSNPESFSLTAFYRLHRNLIELKQFDLAERVVEIVLGPNARSRGEAR